MPIKETTPRDAHEALQLDPSAVYLDVRTEGEFEQGHPAVALNVPVVFLSQPGGPSRPNDAFLEVVRRHVDPSRRVFVGCQSGMRSQRAAQLLAEAGYQDVWNVRGGFGGLRDRTGTVLAEGWRDSGLPVSSGSPSGRSYADLCRTEE